MNINQIEELKLINEFPEKGAAVIAYFHEIGEVVGGFYIGIVESSGSRQFSLRWWCGESERFTSIEGKTDYYKYYSVLAYISYSDYKKYSKKYSGKMLDRRDIENINTCSGVPDSYCIRKFNNQKKLVSKIKKEYRPCSRGEVDCIRHGQKITFIFLQGFNDPVVVSGYARRKNSDSNIYANFDCDLNYADGEDDYILIKKSMILAC